MPVGNSDRGVGLWAGQTMFSLDNHNQYIDWWHETEPGLGEDFDHKGTLSTLVMTPTLTIGLSNYFNLSIAPNIGTRIMTWDSDSTTIHHRNENSLTDFTNSANGGILGDTKLLLRYLVFNDGKGEGKRMFIGGGLIMPSKNTLIADPFFLNGDEKKDHRHFAISEGVYKGLFEFQYYIKRVTNPVFIGASMTIETPIKENKYKYLSPKKYDFIFTALSNEVRFVKSAISTNLIYSHFSDAYWDGKQAPNSSGKLITFGVGLIKNLTTGTIGFSVQKPIFLEGGFSGADIKSSSLEQDVSVWQLQLSYRRVLKFTIPGLDPLKSI